MKRGFNKVRVVVVQPEEQVYFDRYFDDGLKAMDKFNYFCQLASIGYNETPDLVMQQANSYNEISVYFQENLESDTNQSGFVQVSIYFEIG